MSDNWVVQNLENALETWNEKLSEIWTLITTTPQNFKGGNIWKVIVDINGAWHTPTHAPVWGRTSIRSYSNLISPCFNSRPRVGANSKIVQIAISQIAILLKD